MCHDRDYAIQIARDWNVPSSGSGFVTRFDVRSDVASKYPAKTVGGSRHSELWVPAEELDEFNDAIVGQIEVTDRFSSPGVITRLQTRCANPRTHRPGHSEHRWLPSWLTRCSPGERGRASV